MPKSEQTRRRIAAAGGEGRARALTPERRREIARLGYQAMKKKLAQKPTEPSAPPAAASSEGTAA